MRVQGAGALDEAVAFDSPTTVEDDFGGTEQGWAQDYSCNADVKYDRGNEPVEAGRLTGTAVFKVRIRQSEVARGITTDWRMRDTRRDVAYNIREVDAVTDRQWIWLRVEGGVAI